MTKLINFFIRKIVFEVACKSHSIFIMSSVERVLYDKRLNLKLMWG